MPATPMHLQPGIVHTEPRGSTSSLSRGVLFVLVDAAITGALGSLFWLLAPRFYDDDAVAASVAASSLLITLGFVSQLNLGTGLSRFMPRAGAQQRSLLTHAYAVAVGLACVVAAGVVVVGLARGGSVIDGGDLSLTIALAVSLPLWTVFALQDGAMVAVRQTRWIPVENGLAATAKLALLPLLAGLSLRGSILIAWTLPAIPAVIIVNRFLYRKFLHPGHTRLDHHREVIRFAVTDLPGLALTMASLRFVPLFLVEFSGVAAGAHLGVPWSIIAVSALALTSVSRLALSEMSHHPERAAEVIHRLRVLIIGVLMPGAFVGAALSRTVLRAAGPAYAHAGWFVMAAGLLGLVPTALVECELATLRFQGRLGRATTLQSVRAVLLIAGVVGVCVAGRSDWIGVAFLAVNLVTLAVAGIVTREARETKPSSSADEANPPLGKQ
jgi:hypothetical protein